MKKLTLLALMLLGIFLLSACTETTAGQSCSDRLTAEETANLLMGSLKSLNLNLVNEYSDNYVSSEQNWLGITTRREYQVFSDLLQPFHQSGKRYQSNHQFSQKLMENLSWEIKAVRQENTQAEIDMEITNINMQKVTESYAISLLENMVTSQGTGLSGLIKDFSGLIHSAASAEGLLSLMEQTDLNNPENLSVMKVTLNAYQEKDVWKIHLNEDFINAFMGNINANAYSDETEQKINDLTMQYEEKVSEMAEEFERKLECPVN